MKLDNEIRHYFKRWQAEQNVYKEIDIDKEEFEYKSLADEEYFKFKNGIARYTKKYAINNSGLIPMLGSSLKNDCIAYFVKEEKNTDIINQPCVSFNKDNAKGSRAFFRDCPFVMDRHHVCIFSKKVDPEYLCLALDRILIAQKYGWGENVANPSEVKKQHLLVSITSNANIVEKSLVRFIEYYKIQFNQYRQLISQLKSQVESFDKAFLPAIYSAKKDPFIVEYFDLWAQKNKKELSLTSIDFEYVPLFENTDNINLTGSKSLGNHDDIKHIEDADGLPVFDASSSILCHISESKLSR
ncbi:hypothetical protein [Photobacterium toruni]|uniref:Type I restriction modification DNA specificity domain protein n=1 Tax=Photobacterium toruni TaxID=1935446 RepID=A0A1T4T626_9GAMM|nr:hypothetical protein [Photobacterium toruni]SKA35964.1 hypothetical protein CZ814_01997 [Photobacterium toruni]